MHQNGAFVQVLNPQEIKLDLTQASISPFSRRIQVQLSSQRDPVPRHHQISKPIKLRDWSVGRVGQLRTSQKI